MPGSRYGHHGRRTAGHRSRHSGRLWPPLHESRDAGSHRRLATGPGRPPLHAARLRREPALRTRSCRAPLAQRRVPARRHRAAGGRASRRRPAVARARYAQARLSDTRHTGPVARADWQSAPAQIRACQGACKPRAGPLLARRSSFDTRRLCTGGGSPPGPAGLRHACRLPALSMGPTRRLRFKFLNLSP